MEDRRGVPDLRRLTGTAESYYRLHLDAVAAHDFHARVTASWGLIARGRESLPYLLLMLRSRDADSREDAGGALAELGRVASGLLEELLVALRQETDAQARGSVVAALGALKDRAAIPALAAVVRDPGTDGDTRRGAVESLGRIVRRRFDRQEDPEASALAWLDAHAGSQVARVREPVAGIRRAGRARPARSPRATSRRGR